MGFSARLMVVSIPPPREIEHVLSTPVKSPRVHFSFTLREHQSHTLLKAVGVKSSFTAVSRCREDENDYVC